MIFTVHVVCLDWVSHCSVIDVVKATTVASNRRLSMIVKPWVPSGVPGSKDLQLLVCLVFMYPTTSKLWQRTYNVSTALIQIYEHIARSKQTTSISFLKKIIQTLSLNKKTRQSNVNHATIISIAGMKSCGGSVFVVSIIMIFSLIPNHFLHYKFVRFVVRRVYEHRVASL